MFQFHRGYFMYIFFASMAIGAVVLVFNTGAGRAAALGLYAVLCAVMILNKLRYYRNGALRLPGRIILIAVLPLAVGILYFDHTPFVGFYFFILLSSAIITCPVRFSVPYALEAIAVYVLALLYRTGFDGALFWQENSGTMLSRAILVVIIAMSSYSMNVSRKNKELAESLQAKTGELEETLAKLEAYAAELEQTADLRAREALMEELHDRLGHILATAFIGAQAAGVLIDSDVAQARERLEVAARQIQTAMQSLRDVISGRTIACEDEETPSERMLTLVKETPQHTDIPITYRMAHEDLERFDALPVSRQIFLYNALMEGLTNGIRHGQVSRFDFRLWYADCALRFCLKDDGVGFDCLREGYGLSKMRRDAARLGARLTVSGESGCTLEISIPDESMGEALQHG